MTVLPTIMHNGQFTKLWTRATRNSCSPMTSQNPALATHLQKSPQVQRRMRTALGVPTSTTKPSARSARLCLRPRKRPQGDVPTTVALTPTPPPLASRYHPALLGARLQPCRYYRKNQQGFTTAVRFTPVLSVHVAHFALDKSVTAM